MEDSMLQGTFAMLKKHCEASVGSCRLAAMAYASVPEGPRGFMPLVSAEREFA